MRRGATSLRFHRGPACSFFSFPHHRFPLHHRPHSSSSSSSAVPLFHLLRRSSTSAPSSPHTRYLSRNLSYHHRLLPLGPKWWLPRPSVSPSPLPQQHKRLCTTTTTTSPEHHETDQQPSTPEDYAKRRPHLAAWKRLCEEQLVAPYLKLDVSREHLESFQACLTALQNSTETLVDLQEEEAAGEREEEAEEEVKDEKGDVIPAAEIVGKQKAESTETGEREPKKTKDEAEEEKEEKEGEAEEEQEEEELTPAEQLDLSIRECYRDFWMAQLLVRAEQDDLALRALSHFQRVAEDHVRPNADMAVLIDPKLEELFIVATALRGQANFRSGNLKEALADFDEALKKNPIYPLALDYRARIHATLGNREQAVEDATTIVAMEDTVESYLTRGNIYEIMNDFEAAKRDYNTAWQRDPENVMTQLALGCALQQCDDDNGAIQLLSSVLDAEPENTKALLHRCRAYTKQGLFPSAIQDADLLILDSPNDVDLFLMRASIRSEEGDLDAALKDIETVLEKEPENGMALIQKANLLALMEDEEEAMEVWDQVEALAEKDEKIKQMLDRLEKNLKEEEEERKKNEEKTTRGRS
ncbi:Skin secretory protein xP2-like [Balamuthia mandrillaris]